ncbi:molybdate ABC transporter substrate-binding protein [Microlunatus sp. GCM10028923]|uniref:molybdate ABC transporter substrate-binding protein n=1 Tax=Microlunatus sp. GCM10028923 TaxID=3273400 RepID=UPI003618B629
MTHLRIRVLSGLALRSPLVECIYPAFEAEHDVTIEAVFDPTTVLLERLRAGEPADVVIATDSGNAKLVEEGILDGTSTTALATSSIGYAVSGPHPGPPIKETAAFLEFVAGARSIAYTRTGASGIHFMSILENYGLTDDINARATILDGGFTAEALLDGRADVAIQQLSELAAVPGVSIVGPIPDELQQNARFTAAASVRTHPLSPELLRALSGRAARIAYQSAGLQLPIDTESS